MAEDLNIDLKEWSNKFNAGQGRVAGKCQQFFLRSLLLDATKHILCIKNLVPISFSNAKHPRDFLVFFFKSSTIFHKIRT